MKHMRSLAAFGSLLVGSAALGLMVAACVGDDVASVSSTSGDGGNGPGDNGNGNGGDGGSNNGDSGGSCATASCTDPSTLKNCDGKTETCSFGCSEAGGAHCEVVHPSGALLPSDLTTAGALDVTISSDAKFVTDTGAIEGVRAANDDPLKTEVKDGIGFRIADDGQGHKVAVWSFKSLKIDDGKTVRFTAANAAALVAAGNIEIVGVVDARGYDAAGTLCGDTTGGPGGGSGGKDASAATGEGGGKAPVPMQTYSGGPSGGSFGGVGGKGGNGGSGASTPGAAAGTIYGTPGLTPLVGGSGGGGTSYGGGGGGGAIQLVAGTKVSIGGGTSPGGVNAGGCNGATAYYGNAGGAGGSGGAILIEAPNLELLSNGVIAANGGGGATGGGGTAAQPGQLSSAQCYAGGAPNGYGVCGGGSGGYTVYGGSGGAPSGTSGAGGSGGGGAGRIRINNRSGSFTVPPSTTISPVLGISPDPPSTVGTLDVR